jgi:hypothetical protein
MSRPPISPLRLRLGFSGWAAIAASLALLAAIIAALAFLAIGLFVVFLPVMLLAPVLYYFMPRPKPTHPRRNGQKTAATKDATIIDGEFRVISAAENRSGPAGEIEP